MTLLDRPVRRIEFGPQHILDRDRTYVMAILNVTGDSFSGDGVIEPAVLAAQAERAIAAGADMLDLGAESTRPGAEAVSAEEELRRLLPALRAVKKACPHALVSIDTYKAEVFRAAHHEGAHLLNSVHVLGDNVLQVIRDCDAPCVLMQPGLPDTVVEGSAQLVIDWLACEAGRLLASGIRAEQLILDPGIGFGKTPDQNIAVLSALERLGTLGFPTLLGASRKSTLGLLTDRAVDAREFATAATTAFAAAARIDIVRVHDVAAARDVVRVSDAVVRGRRPAGWRSMPA